MRDNEATVLVGEKCILVPYRRQHVQRYHEWMADPVLQQQTASEPLSLEQEYDMQASWHDDPDKLTFIILAKSPSLDRRGNGGISGTDHAIASAAPSSPPSPSGPREGESIDEWLQAWPMCGDVNMFFQPASDDDAEEAEGHATSASPYLPTPKLLDAECELMIADPQYRRHGIGREALLLLLTYARCTPSLSIYRPPPPRPRTQDLPAQAQTDVRVRFMAKISLANAPSLALFRSLGFATVRISDVWAEAELHLRDEDVQTLIRSQLPLNTLMWPVDSCA
ncbi:hypothetical protein K437DRAFT_293864 [Tilletiaria anomala UBC 951]|uniref:Uncharacterized protein n=1 Tax=Tilletiaria anomala (strain ATCC 24038 / CBS 436.72 / UBC 951) TaxID=1037660 RepID=A0A066WCM4_TILAU|nr:uncharacterized protein K437DRAFT_293864 [Tilletiaria anomala UBC 951]KDN48530.1 hypothetical protein K437DRAFT_293864 [Tilletiaria anomala UBC 951]